MALVITVTDQGNGGGVVVAVTGITGTSSVQDYRQALDATGWTAFGSPISADGNVSGTVATGYYWWRAERTASFPLSVTQSNFVRQVVRGADDALYQQIADSIVARLRDAISANAFPGITDTTRVKQVYEYIPEVFPANVPGIAVVTNGKKLSVNKDSEYDYKAFPVQIVCATRGTSNTPVRGTDPYFVWQEAIESLFLHQRMYDIVKNGVELNYDNDISYPDAVQFLKQNYQDVRVALQVNVFITEPRGP